MVDISLQAAIAIVVSILFPMALWCWRMKQQINEIQVTTGDLMALHKDPESLFSTQRTNILLENQAKENSRLLGELIYYIKAMAEAATGKKIPPPLPKA